MIAPAPPAIHLDTSFLVRALVAGSAEGYALRGWIRDRREIAMSTLAWSEFLCGAEDGADPAVLDALGRRVVRRHVPLATSVATLGAELFNRVGRPRTGLADCLILASALEAEAELATSDRVQGARARTVDVGVVGVVESD